MHTALNSMPIFSLLNERERDWPVLLSALYKKFYLINRAGHGCVRELELNATHSEIPSRRQRKNGSNIVTHVTQRICSGCSDMRLAVLSVLGFYRAKQRSKMRDLREKRDLHGLNEDGMLICNPRDREAAHRAQVEGIATERPEDVTCPKCKALWSTIRKKQ
jgi:hypothetical protein